MNNISIELLEGTYNTNPDVIFNRFDLLYNSNQYIYIVADAQQWTVPYKIEGNIAFLGLYLVEIPKNIFDELIHFIFQQNRHIHKIYLKRSRNNYHKHIRQGNHFRIELPDTFDSLLERLSKKGRYNYKREKRLLHNIGDVEYMHYDTQASLNNIVAVFFSFKYKTHGRDYHMLPEEYVKNYSVSDAYSMQVNGKIVAVLLSCEQCECVFLENLSYDIEFEKYSVGFQIYVFFLSEMIKKERKHIFLGGGEYEYKKRFSSIEEITYDGYIYKTTWGKLQSVLKNRIKKRSS